MTRTKYGAKANATTTRTKSGAKANAATTRTRSGAKASSPTTQPRSQPGNETEGEDQSAGKGRLKALQSVVTIDRLAWKDEKPVFLASL